MSVIAAGSIAVINIPRAQLAADLVATTAGLALSSIACEVRAVA